MIINNFVNITKKLPKLQLLFFCDHASNLIPNQYKKLGLKDKILKSHIAYDIGAQTLTKKLSSIFKTNAVLAKYSRLFIDLNRDKNHINLITEKSDGVEIPGNKTPNAVLIGNLTQKVGFFFGSSASFSEKDSDGVGPAGPSGMLSSSHYTSFGKPAQGTILNIHPTAWSGSLADDKDKAITLIYKSGLSTGGF